MSDQLITILVSLGIMFLGMAAWLALKQVAKANRIAAIALVEKYIGGKIYAPTMELELGTEYNLAELLRAAQFISEKDMNEFRVFEHSLNFDLFMQEIKKWADKIHVERVGYDQEAESEKTPSVFLFRLYKGRKYLSLAFRVKELVVVPELVPAEQRKQIRNLDTDPSMLVITQGVCFMGDPNVHYQAKADFFDQLYAACALPGNISWKPEVKYGRFSRFCLSPENILYTETLYKDPTRSYMAVNMGRQLTLKYHGLSYSVSQQTALDLIAKHAIAEDQSTVVLKGAPGSGKTAFMTFLQRELSQDPKVHNIILGNDTDLQMFAGPEGRNLQNRWAESEDGINVIFIDDASNVLADKDHSQSLASFMDGQIQKLTRTVLVLSINRDMKDVPEDLQRTGRMSVVLEFPQLSATEAKALATELKGIVQPPKAIDPNEVQGKSYPVNEVFDLIRNDGVNSLGKELGKLKQESPQQQTQQPQPQANNQQSKPTFRKKGR